MINIFKWRKDKLNKIKKFDDTDLMRGVSVGFYIFPCVLILLVFLTENEPLYKKILLPIFLYAIWLILDSFILYYTTKERE